MEWTLALECSEHQSQEPTSLVLTPKLTVDLDQGSLRKTITTVLISGSKHLLIGKDKLSILYFSCFRKNGQQLKFEGHVKSSVVGTDDLHVDVITGRSLVLRLQGSDELDIEVNNVMEDGRGFYNATFCVTLIRADKDEIEE